MVLEGVSLAQYAKTVAALAEDFALDDVAATLGLSAPAWPAARSAWGVHLAQHPDAFSSFAESLADAEDRLVREVDPIDRDLEAWTRFLAAWAKHPAPIDLLAERGLRQNDLARLSRAWTRKMAAEPKLAKKAEKLAKSVDAAATIPDLRIGQSKLSALGHADATTSAAVAAPAAIAASAPIAPVAAPAARPSMDIDRYAALCAEIEADGADATTVLQAFGVTEAQRRAAEEQWQAAFAADPELARDFRALSALAERRVRQRGHKLRAPAPAPPPAPAPVPMAAPAPAPVAPPVVAPVPAPAPGRRAIPAALLRTVRTSDEPRGPALPFKPAPKGRPPKELIATAPVDPDRVRKGTELPYGPDKARPRSPPAKSAERRANERKLGTTSPTARKRKDPTLPFGAPPVQPAGPPVERSAAEKRLQETSMALDVPRDLFPFPKPKDKAAPRAPPPAAGRPPSLTLEQHASLCVELAMPRARAAEVLARYGIDADGKARLDAHFLRELERDPSLRPAWNEAYRKYHAWLIHTRR